MARNPVKRSLLRPTLLLLATASAPAAAIAQCAPTWQPVPTGGPLPIASAAAMPNGDLIVGGSFTEIGGVAAKAVARWDGATWSPLGAGMTGTIFIGANSVVNALLVLPDGDLIAAGDFTSAGAVTTNSIARWDGAQWHALDAGINGIVRSLAQLPNGDVVAGGLFPVAGTTLVSHVARWDGAQWHALGDGVNAYFVHALATMPNGDLIAAGNFFVAGGVTANKIARWDGVAWSPLGAGMSDGLFITEVLSLAVLPDGDLIAGGTFGTAGGTAANNIARWDGAQWHALGDGVQTVLPDRPSVHALSVLPDGDLLVAGRFTTAGAAAANHIARWRRDGSWTAFGAGTDNTVSDLTTMPNGDRIVSGWITAIDGVAIDGVVRMSTTCPATAVSYGSGCVTSGGTTSLQRVDGPWRGGTFRAVATGLPQGALAVGIFAFDTLALPMPTVHPSGVAGCELLVSDEILLQFRVANGAVETSIDIPDASALVGGTFYHQVVPIELDAGGAITAMASTNALALTVGAF